MQNNVILFTHKKVKTGNNNNNNSNNNNINDAFGSF